MATEYRLSHTASEIDRKLSEIDNLGKVKTVNGVGPDENGNVEIGVGQISPKNLYYNATEYGVIPESTDNTSAMQTLINTVHDNGGGIIWLPIGEYRFDSSRSVAENIDFRACLTPKSGVSIIGESLTDTVVKVYGATENGATWLANFVADKQDKSIKLSGCTYQNFTVDMSDVEMTVGYSSTGKAFGMKSLKDCVFRNLRLLNTPSTALGIDSLDNVVVDSVYIYRGGRKWDIGGQGGAGIGIGTGKWENENFVVRNCICVECGHFGIFLEDQGLFNNLAQNHSEGATITNNVIRNGRNYGIGIRGGRNVVVTGNNVYGNKGGIYLDYGAKNVMVSNNIIADSTESGVMFGIDDDSHGAYVCENISVFGNSFFENAHGVQLLRTPLNSRIRNNIYIGNDADCITDIPIDSGKIKHGVYINDAGEEATNERSWLYDEFIDVSNTRIIWTPIGVVDGINHNPRIAIYDENKTFLHRINGDYEPSELDTIVVDALTTAGKSTNYRYIKFGDNCYGEIIATLMLYAVE